MLMIMHAVVHADARWLATLRGIQQTFRHKSVTVSDIATYEPVYYDRSLEDLPAV